MNFQIKDAYKAAWKSPELPTYCFIYLLIGLLAVPKSFLLVDLDVCWLVRTGELIWQTGQLPATDVFSFTHNGHPWVLYQWGFELFVGGLHLLAGLGGVVWGGALLIALAYSLLFNFLLRLGIHRGMCMGMVALTMLINSFHWLCRPNTASILFYIFLLILLEGYRYYPGRKVWLLPLLFLLWANVHLGFISGLMVVLLYGLWAWFAPSAFRGPESSKDSRLLLVFALCLLATCINPYGPSLLVYLWQLSQATNMNARIGELHSPNFHSPVHFTLILLFVLVFWIGGRKYSGRELLLTLMCITLTMALFSTRHIPYFSIPAAIHLAYAWRARKNQASEAPLPSVSQGKGWGWGLLGGIVCLAWVVFIAQWRPGFYDFDEKRVPKGATAYLGKLVAGPEPSRIFTTGGGGQWNDYLLYHLYPRIRVFIDTRFDMYGDDFFKKFIMLDDKLRCDLKSLDPWKIDFLIFKKDNANDKEQEKNQEEESFG